MRAELARVEATCKDIPIVIGGEEIRNDNVKYQVSPYNHSQKIAKYYWADKDLLHKAANAAVAAQVSLWSLHSNRFRQIETIYNRFCSRNLIHFNL